MSKLRDAVYGFAVGDALGVPYEFKRGGTFLCTDMVGGGTWGQLPGTWSDDTSMLLATCDSIREWGRVDPTDIMDRFCHWYFGGDYTARGDVFDIGCTTRDAIRRYVDGVPAYECGGNGIRNNGNGSLMRILPLAFTDCGWELVYRVSALTHRHQIAMDCCWDLVYYARALIEGDAKLPIGAEVISTGYVADTLDAALWCLSATDNYRDCVLLAVNLGGDTDTVAAIAGGLAGIKYGFDAIPKEWIEQLANKELIESCLF
jgi:ADP-ribosylglycohydrolase